MQKLVISDFSGGIQEALSADDFSPRQWAQLKGVVPTNQSNFKSQWPAQRVSTTADNAGFEAVFPLESPYGTFLVGIKTTGTLWWAKVPPATDAYSVANAVVWYELGAAINAGIPGTNPRYFYTVQPNPDYRFLTGLDFEAYKYLKYPLYGGTTQTDRSSDFSQDLVPGDLEAATAPAVVIGCRRRVNANGEFGMWESADINSPAIPAHRQQILVAFVDGRAGSYVDYTGVGTKGRVSLVVFPNLRRWPTYTRNYSATDPAGTPIANWAQMTVSGVVYGVEERAYPIIPFVTSTEFPGGQDKTFATSHPFPATDNGTFPNPKTAFHPYTYLDRNSTLLPGKGIIPRANVGATWNGQLILGDIEWLSEKAVEANSSKKKVTAPGNRAVLGSAYLTDDNTDVHRGKFYFSRDDIDEFDPRNVFGVSGSDARVAGMHMLDNYLVCVTTFNGANDGVVALSGNLNEIISYGGTPRPFAVRRQLIRGGIGVADYPTTHVGHVTQSCVWPEAGNVVFVDKFGGIYATDGRSCDRLDRYGPKQPAGSTFRDHVAAVEKHLLTWRNGRLLVLTIVESNADQGSACWTEIVPPPGATAPAHIKSMVGAANQFFMVVNGVVWRYCVNGPEAEYGYIDGTTKVDIVVSTATIGDTNEYRKTNWFRVGFSFYTNTVCWLKEVRILAEAALSGATGVPSHTISHGTPGKEFDEGHHEVVYPAGIGKQTVMSVRYTFSGNVTLNGAAVWGTGGVMDRGDKG